MEKWFEFTGQQIYDEITAKQSDIKSLEDALNQLHPISERERTTYGWEDAWSKDTREAIKLLYKAYAQHKEQLKQLLNNSYKAACKI